MEFMTDFIQHKLDAAIDEKIHKAMKQAPEEQIPNEIKHKNRNPSETINNTDNIFGTEEFPPLMESQSSQQHRQPAKTLIGAGAKEDDLQAVRGKAETRNNIRKGKELPNKKWNSREHHLRRVDHDGGSQSL